MESIYKSIEFSSQPSVKELIEWVSNKNRETILLDGLYSSAKAFAISTAAKKGIHIILLNNREDAIYYASDFNNLIGFDQVFFFPASINYNTKSKNRDSSSLVQRTATIQSIVNLKKSKDKGDKIIIAAYPHSILEKIPNEREIANSILKINKGDRLSHQFIREALQESGFIKTDFVSEPGQFAIRGGLIDLFSYSDNRPYRLDFFGDIVESIRVFDIDTQRSLEDKDSVEIFPDLDTYIDEGDGLSLLDFIGDEALLWIPDIITVREEIEDFKITNKAVLFGPLSGSLIKEENIERTISFHTTPQPSFNKNFELLVNEIEQKKRDGYQVNIFSGNQNQIERLKSIFSSFRNRDIGFNAINKSIHEGFIDHIAKLCFYTDHQIFEKYHRVKTNRSVEKSERLTINDLNAFQIGDYIVHIEHGVGVFGGLVKTEQNGKVQEVVKLIYRDGDVIFLSIHSLHRIARYKSKDSEPPKVHKLGSGAWEKLKNQTKSKVKDIANDLIELYAKRREVKGFAFSADSYMQQELEASFIYEDTPDQYKATQAVKDDMERSWPMDRLICGDVGFGKTEVAIRAAFKAVADSKQVAVLVPTTILALQHYNTFNSRLKDFPCRTQYLSRLKSAKEIREIAADLENGKIDIIIGTHRLLNKEIKYKDLGLLIIDEEQKFGVAAKERLRQIKTNVDTLTITATPIPRTLQFSLLGARDLSIINTPPPNRLPIQTEIIDFDEDIIRETINYEIERGGQVFFIHNRVEDIKEVETIINRLCPNIKTCVGHGKMEATILERVILDFMMGDYDLLVSTTIIENGIDIPNVNTIIVNQAQNFGLSDLHQLRGRVGRSNKKAFCYLVVPSKLAITEEAKKRLRAIEAFSDLGSGFNIAMQDLDIRGAGNLLGAEQSGFIADMGFETYQRILSEAVDELRIERGIDIRGDTSLERTVEKYISDCSIETDLEVLIPDSYVNITSEKIRLYKEMNSVESEEELMKFLSSMIDRFGPIPKETEELADTVRLRWLAMEMGFEKIMLKNNMLIAYFINNKMSDYYKSDIFAGVLSFIQKQGRRFELKEQKDRLFLVVKGVINISKAYKIFSEMCTSEKS